MCRFAMKKGVVTFGIVFSFTESRRRAEACSVAFNHEPLNHRNMRLQEGGSEEAWQGRTGGICAAGIPCCSSPVSPSTGAEVTGVSQPLQRRITSRTEHEQCPSWEGSWPSSAQPQLRHAPEDSGIPPNNRRYTVCSRIMELGAIHIWVQEFVLGRARRKGGSLSGVRGI